MKNSEKLQTIYDEFKINAVSLASILGVSKELLYMIYDGKRDISKNIASRLETFFGIPFEWSREGTGGFKYDRTLANKTLESIDDTTPHLSVVKETSKEHDNLSGVPMYNAPGMASGVETYTDRDSTKVVGYINFPGITKGSFALPIYGNSMSPGLESGSWAVCRPIENKFSINWGQIYYIEYHDYRVFKRLLASDNPDEVILWSDNQDELINGRPKHAPVTIKKSEIRSLSLVTDVYKKSNH